MLTFLGTGNAFAKNNTSAYFIRDNDLFLFDCGETIFSRLKEFNLLQEKNNINIFLTHFHSDHCGSLGSILFYLASIGFPFENVKVFSPEQDKLKTLLQIFDVADICNLPTAEEVKALGIEPYKQKHHSVYSYGYLIENQGETEYFTGDTQEIPDEILIKFLDGKIDRLYVDTTFNPNCEYHMTFEQLLEAIPEHLRKNVYCMHLKENYDESLINQFNIAKERGE